MTDSGNPIIGPLRERDLPAAAAVVCQAFGTFVGAPDLGTFWNDRDLVRSRTSAPHVAAFGATLDGALVGSTSRPAGAASAISGRSRFVPTCGIAASAGN